MSPQWLENEENGAGVSPSTTESMAEEGSLGEEPVKDAPFKTDSSHSRNLMLGDSMYSKLDALLSQTQLYSEFLLEKMDNIELISEELKMECGREKGVKRKIAEVNSRASTKATKTAHLSFSGGEEDTSVREQFLTENESIFKEQKVLLPLLTGGALKSYQLKGVKWLISLWQNGLNGILADQMGLGKTIQAIGLLAHLKGKGMHGPFLVCAPLSTLSNWVHEIKRFFLNSFGLA